MNPSRHYDKNEADFKGSEPKGGKRRKTTIAGIDCKRTKNQYLWVVEKWILMQFIPYLKN